LLKFTIEKVLKTGLVFLIQYRQSITLSYASPCRISHGTLTHARHITRSRYSIRCARCKIYQTFSQKNRAGL